MTPERYQRRMRGRDRHLAGVADQQRPCPNGDPDCPGPNPVSGMLPCSGCFLGGGEA